MTENKRIVCKDNFDREGPGHDERFILWPMPEEDARAICAILNKRGGDYAPHFFDVKPFDYKLRTFEP